MAESIVGYTPEEQREVDKIQAERSFMGHPKMVGVMSIFQIGSGIGNYGLNAILIFYLYTQAPGGLGFTQLEATQLIALYSPLITLAGIIGSIVCDKILGPRKAFRYSRILGFVTWPAIAFLGKVGYFIYFIGGILGSMIAGASFYTLLGMLYKKGDGRKDAGFAILYMIGNIGSAAPLITGAISQAAGYSAAMVFVGFLMICSNIMYLFFERKWFGPIGMRPDDPMTDEQRKSFLTKLLVGVVLGGGVIAGVLLTGVLDINGFANIVSTALIFAPIVYFAYIVKSKKTTDSERRHLVWLIPIFAILCLNMVVWTQSTTIIAIYIDQNVDLNLFGIQLHASMFQTVPAVLAVIFGAVVTGLWTKLGKRQPNSPFKAGLGSVFWGLGPVFMCLPFLLYPAGVKVSPLWIIGFYCIIIIGEALNDPVGRSLCNTVAPAAFVTQMMNLWGMGMSTGSAITSLAANFYIPGYEVPYFLVIGGVTAAAGLAVVVFSKKINSRMGIDAATEQAAA